MRQDTAQVVLIAEVIRVRCTGSRPGHGSAQGGEHPPHGSTLRHRLDDRPGRLQAGSKCGELGQCDVGAFQLAGRRQHVGCDLGELVVGDVDDREHVEHL